MNAYSLKPDIILKNFWRENRRFADLFNTVLFEGKPILRPEELQEQDTDVSTVWKQDNYFTMLQKTRDVVKKSAFGIDFVILGIENQMNVHYAMPLRVMIYDALGYLKEYSEFARFHKKEKTPMTSEEFFSRMKKEDRLHPIITLVIYYNERPWDGPFSLLDMMLPLSNKMKSLVADYPMHLLEIRDSETYTFGNSDIQTVFEISRMIFREDYERLRKTYETKTIPFELAVVVGAITRSKELIETAVAEKGDINMCTALEKLKEEGVREGQREFEQLIQKLFALGRIEDVKRIAEDREYRSQLVKELLISE